MKVIPKKTFLLRQVEVEGGKKKDVIAKQGVKIEVSENEAAAFYGLFEIDESDKKKLIVRSKQPNSNLRRVV
jgi:hypothetical protein